tara:strand:+ start:85 stop:1047 length:963 start_codon:yes stop_codon:yes gene_type:complete
MQSLSCISHVKRSDDYIRPPAPPVATFVHVITDRSGSMVTMNGLQIPMNKKLLDETKELAEKTETPTYVTFTTFDDIVQHLAKNKNILDYDIPSEEDLESSLKPRGTTRFIDTVLEAIEDVEEKYQEFKKTLPDKVRALDPRIVRLINCTTDGMDNCSNQDQNDLCKAMTSFRKNGGEALLLAANMDAQKIGRQYGFNSDIALTVHASDPDAIEFAFESLRTQSHRVTSGGSAIPYTQLERQTSQALPDPLDSPSSGLSLQCPMPPRLVRHPGIIRQNAIINGFSDDEDDGFSQQFALLSPPPIQRVRPLRRSNRIKNKN